MAILPLKQRLQQLLQTGKMKFWFLWIFRRQTADGIQAPGFTGMSGFAGRRQSILWQTDATFLQKRSRKRSGAFLFMQKP